MVLGSAAILLGSNPTNAQNLGRAPHQLLIRVRNTAPGTNPNFLHERDGSYTVSTGAGEDRDERSRAPNNAQVVSTSASVRLVRVREGEPVRVDLPSVQTLQFHVPPGKSFAQPRATVPPGGPSQATAGTTPGASNSRPVGPPSTPATSAVVYFEAVSAFAARFALVGNGGIRIDLVPMQAGEVAAPYAVAPGGEGVRAAVVFGRVGEWIALGDMELVSSGKSLNVTAEPPSQPSVWVRVEPDDRP
ncbi:MAG TPA: hypothetical protein VEE84_04685 [Burkholderiaceae bacterium]|nr:hypothetical protein [Burkholderiaceae bacterium]